MRGSGWRTFNAHSGRFSGLSDNSFAAMGATIVFDTLLKQSRLSIFVRSRSRDILILSLTSSSWAQYYHGNISIMIIMIIIITYSQDFFWPARKKLPVCLDGAQRFNLIYDWQRNSRESLKLQRNWNGICRGMAQVALRVTCNNDYQ